MSRVAHKYLECVVFSRSISFHDTFNDLCLSVPWMKRGDLRLVMISMQTVVPNASSMVFSTCEKGGN